MRAAIYARYSTDLQNERSIADQAALCRDFASRQNVTIVATFDDAARSGATIAGRPGLQALLAMAQAGAIDAIIVEHLDRLSRDMADLAAVHKHLAFKGVRLISVNGGEADTMRVGLEGLMGQLFRENTAAKVRRGMTGVIRDGRSAGGRAYGYKPVPGRPGELTIVDSEATVLRRIFAEYVAGHTPRQIAAALNAEGVPAPRGTLWRASTINGNAKRGHGILVNPLYSGEIVWGRVRMVRDPTTGKRLSRAQSGSVESIDVPHLAIIDPEVFAAAQARRKARSGDPRLAPRAPRRLLSGLLRCGVCGAGLNVKDRKGGRVRIRCSTVIEAGTCTAKAPYPLDDIEAKVIAGLKERLRSREAIELYVRTYNEERQRLSADLRRRRGAIERRLAQIAGEYDRAVDNLVSGTLAEDDGARILPKLRAQRQEIRAELEACEQPPTVVSLMPAVITDYMHRVDCLAEAIREGLPHGAESMAALRDLIDTVTVHPRNDRGVIAIDVKGKLNRLLGPDAFPTLRGGLVGSGGGT